MGPGVGARDRSGAPLARELESTSATHGPSTKARSPARMLPRDRHRGPSDPGLDRALVPTIDCDSTRPMRPVYSLYLTAVWLAAARTPPAPLASPSLRRFWERAGGAMRVDMVGAVLAIVLGHDDQRVGGVATVRHGLDQATDRHSLVFSSKVLLVSKERAHSADHDRPGLRLRRFTPNRAHAGLEHERPGPRHPRRRRARGELQRGRSQRRPIRIGGAQQLPQVPVDPHVKVASGAVKTREAKLGFAVIPLAVLAVADVGQQGGAVRAPAD